MIEDFELPIETVLNHHGWEGHARGRGWETVKCPYHDDTTASASLNVELGAFNCHACGISGDAIKLIMQWEGLSFGEAVRVATETYGAQSSAPSYGLSRTRDRHRPRRQRGRR